MNQTNYILNNRKEILITKEELINYLYFLLDKIDPAYLNEISISINRFIQKLESSHETNYNVSIVNWYIFEICMK